MYENARSFLRDNNVAEKKIEEICVVINAVSFSQNRGRIPATLEANCAGCGLA